MSFFKRKTVKLFHSFPQRWQSESRVTKVGRDYIELDSTVAYPEGGGQEPDYGLIALPDGTEISFNHVRKMYGTRLDLSDMPDVAVDGVIEHVIAPVDIPRLSAVSVGMQVTVRINATRRKLLSTSHTASHFLYLGVKSVRPEAVDHTLGCHIHPDGARFDFRVWNRFTEHEVSIIEEIANAFIKRGNDISLYANEAHEDARYWQCENHVVPCGGTHVASAALVPSMKIRRKSLGKNKERLSLQFTGALPNLNGK